MNDILLKKDTDCWRGSFTAMASPCEVLIEVGAERLAWRIVKQVADEARRIEAKFSRYRDDNIVSRINAAEGKAVEVDDETARLIDFADQLYQMSDGLFDITSGVLRRVWRFDCSDNIPDPDAVHRVLKLVGWHGAEWQDNMLWLNKGMEVDLGGIGKEYAVDRCIQKVCEITDSSVLINFGGDLAVSHARNLGKCWSVGRLITGRDQAVALFQLHKGAIATSGDANRYLLKNGRRYSHVLNPQTGWPIDDAPHTVSVAANTCTEAGMFSTLAMLQGKQAEAFLKLQGVEYWID
ncbi:MAG: FAD:protein FMN transferase [Gammaproteobacteria bacterium]|nr:FAD:protein FMN transferase [Gammaproteobacteria bacterium]